MTIPAIWDSVRDIWDQGRKLFLRTLGELSIKMTLEWLNRLSLMGLKEHFIAQMLLFHSLGELMDFLVVNQLSQVFC